jgi:hypothetical protein
MTLYPVDLISRSNVRDITMSKSPSPKRKPSAPKEPKPLGRRPMKGDRKDFVARLPLDMVAEMDTKTAPGFSRNDIVTEAVGDWLKTRRQPTRATVDITDAAHEEEAV